jgi:hypothetical protein
MPTPDTPMALPSQRMLTTLEITSNTSALCDAIPVLWQNTDYQILSLLGQPITANTSPSSSSTGSSVSNAIPTAIGDAFSPTKASSSNLGLSQRPKIGIGVAIPIVVVGLILGAFFYFRHRNVLQRVEEVVE